MEVFRSRFLLDYDIACAFFKTLMNSSLGPKARELMIRMLVGSFHGHAHNRGCQLDWHLLYVKGAGHAALKNCESIFSASNAVTPGIWHASQFHWHQALEQHFAFWDEDKYANLSKYSIFLVHSVTHCCSGSFIFNHYREALEIIRTRSAELVEIRKSLNIADGEFEQYLDEERSYLRNLRQESPEDTIRFDYVEALDDLVKCR
jgi:hypothetical protein